MEDWGKYYLRDIPFMEGQFIQPELNDDRLNGKIFSMYGMEKPYKRLMGLIDRHKNICYVRSDNSSRGTGKSALMAKVYWDIKSEKAKQIFPVWTGVHDFRTINQLMGRVVDTLVLAGLTDKIKEKLGEVNQDTVGELLSQRKDQRTYTEIAALTEILSLPNEMLAWKYMNIRRKYSTMASVELFSDLMMMFGAADQRRVIVFIDQFEEYVEYQRGMRMRELGQDIKDLYRCMTACGNLTFILSMHPETQRNFESMASEIIESYGEIMENAATVEKLETEHLVPIAKTYMNHYRTAEYEKNKIGDSFPFTESTLRYVASNSNNNPRKLIRLLGNLLWEAMLSDTKEINDEFVKNPVVHSNAGLGAIPASA